MATTPITTPIFGAGESYYVPHFEVKVGGKNLDPMVIRDIMQVTYRDKIGELDSVELTINNWDAQLQKPKYEPPSKPAYEKMFDPGKTLDLVMGYAGNAKSDRLMLSGEITTLDPVFPESGPTTLTVRALSRLAKYRKKQHSFAWYNLYDTQIAQKICQSKVTDNKPGLDIGFDPNPSYESHETKNPYVFMDTQYDIVFLLERARRNGYSLNITSDPNTGKDVLSFKPSDQIKAVTYELAWGVSLCDFHPTLTTANQISKVTVRAWDGKAGRPIEGSAIYQDLKINRDLLSAARVIEGREEVITDRPVYSKDEAKALARSIMANQLYEMVKATGSTVGLPDLRAGCRVSIKKLGPRFSGSYFVTETTHTFGDNGYRTSFGARRESPEGSAS